MGGERGGHGRVLLTYTNSGGGALPSSVWASGNDASLYLVAVLNGALAAAPDRNLYPFLTGAVVADNLDPSKLNVFAQATDGSDVATVATAPPGNIAFELTRPNATPGSDPTPEERTQSLFNLLAYAITGTGFNASPLALPVGPTGTGSTWSYDQTVAVYRLAQAIPADMAPGLPPGAGDPYAGIGAGAAVDVALGFRDVFGNEIDAVVPDLTGIPVGYYDDVRGLSAWPGASAAYAITGSAGNPMLELQVDLGLDKYVPSPSNLFATAVRTAAAHQAIYGQVHYQIQQPDVTFSLATSLDPPDTTHLTGAALEAPLRAFVIGTYLYLGTAQTVQQLAHPIDSSGEKLGDVATAYTVTPGQLLAANSAADASQLIDGQLTVLLQHVFAASDTLSAIAAASGQSTSALLTLNQNLPLATGIAVVTQAWRYTTQALDTLVSIAQLEDTTPSAVAVANTSTTGILDTTKSVSYGGKTQPIGSNDTFGTLAADLGATVAELAVANQNTALFLPNVAVFIAGAPVPPGDTGGARIYTTGSGDTLGSIARTQRCTVAGLGLANGQAVVLDKTKSVEVGGTTVPIRDGTLATVVADLLTKDTRASIADVAAAIADPPTPNQNVLLTNVTLAIPDYVTVAGDTIAGILHTYRTVFTLDQIALLNGPLPSGIYLTGTALTTGTEQLTPTPGDSFAGIAARLELTIDQLAAANAGTMLKPGQEIMIPGAVTLGTTQQAAYQVPFTANPTPKLSDIATALDAAPAELGTLNATMPRLVAAGIAITYTPTGKQTTTTTTDTLSSVAARVGAADAAALLTDPAVSGLAGLVAAGAVLQCPLPPVAGRSLAGLAQALGVDTGDVANANSALVGLVAPGQSLVVSHVDPLTGQPAQATITTTVQDTLASAVRKLQLQVPVIDMSDLLATYGDSSNLLTGVSIIVPPARVPIASPMSNPQVGAAFTALWVNLTIARDEALVDPAAKQNGLSQAISVTTALAPDLDSYGGMPGFAAAFETALANLRIKLAVGPDPDEAQRRLWVVDFGAAGFPQVDIQGSSPRFFALAPISQNLVSGPASIKIYNPADGTLSATTVTQTFASIDLDAWMRTALDAIDLFLAPAAAAPSYGLAPTALTTIVDAKATIAAALRTRVAEILLDGNANNGALAAAQEALYQSMLVTLGTAYTTDAVVQFPVTVNSPYGPTYTTGSADTYATVAAAYHVSPEAAQAEFAGIVQGGIFPKDTTLDQSAMLCTTGTSDTFATLATFFAADPGSVGVAALDVAGLVPKGTVVGSYTVQQADSLRDIQTHSGIPAATIAQDLAQAGTVLTSGISVRCFSALNPIAPRLFGKPEAERYTAIAGNTSPDLLAWFGVSPAALGEAIADMRGILCVGTVVTNTANNQQYTIAAGDTFRSLVGPLGASDVGTLLPTLSVPAGASLLDPGVAVALGRVSHNPTASDSFTSLATFFDDDPASLAVANELIGSAFVPGAVLTLASKATYTVKGPESIEQVAAALGTTPEKFATDSAIVDLAGIFNPATALRGLQILPEFSLSTAKLPLIDGTQYVSFLFGTSADARFKTLFLNLDYSVGELEFQVTDVSAANGYQESDWLRFGLPLDQPPLQPGVQLDAGQTAVPIPLRAYPQLPLMQSLAACPTWTAPQHPPTTVGEAKQWYLSATVEHLSAAQDEMLIEVAFNSGAPVQRLGDASTTLFDKLAQLVTAWPTMQHDVAALGALAPGAQNSRLATMVGSFATLASELAVALSTPALLAGASNGGGASQLYTFLLDTTYDFSGTDVQTVDLALQPDSTQSEVPWPAIWVSTPDLEPTRLSADPVDSSSQTRRYYYPPGIQASATLTHTYALPDTSVPINGGVSPVGRDAVQWQSGQVSAAVRRNAELVGGAATSPAFIYQTPWISFTNPAVPLLQTATPIVLTGADFEARLASGLTALLTSDGQTLSGSYNVRLLCRYALELSSAVPDSRWVGLGERWRERGVGERQPAGVREGWRGADR